LNREGSLYVMFHLLLYFLSRSSSYYPRRRFSNTFNVLCYFS